MFSQIASYALIGLDGEVVTVEVDISRGLGSFGIVGLPDAISESHDRSCHASFRPPTPCQPARH